MSEDSSRAALFTAPHRVAFLPGMLFAVLLLAAWGAQLASRLLGHPLLPTLPPAEAHAFLMLFGFFPLFMAGFLFTAGPRWLNVPPPSRARYLAVPGLMVAGLALWLAGLWLGQAWLLAGHALYTLGFAGLLATLIALYRASPAPDRLHALAILIAFALGLAALLAAGYWLASGDESGWRAMRDLALWGYLLPVFLTVCHRMLPFFSASSLPQYTAWRPYWLLWTLLAGSLAHGLLSLAALPSWPVDLPLALLFAYVSWRWRLAASLKVRLLAMLHLSFAWLPVGFGLYAWAGLVAPLGLAPLHAVATGFFLTMMVGFVSRVTLGHSGRQLAAGSLLWGLYLATHLMAALRVAADLLPTPHAPLLYTLAALGYLIALLIWACRYAPMTWKPRADGKAG